MKAIARCEFVSPIKDFTSKKGEAMKKVEVKFSFADADDNYMNSVLVSFFNEKADKLAQRLRAGECYEIHLSVQTYRTASGAEFNDLRVRAILHEGKDLIQ